VVCEPVSALRLWIPTSNRLQHALSTAACASSCRRRPAGRRLAWLSTCGRRPVVTLARKGELSQAIFCILLSIVGAGKQEVPLGARLAGVSHAHLVVVRTPLSLHSDSVIRTRWTRSGCIQPACRVIGRQAVAGYRLL
jgi:hypothetical protein